MSDLFFTTLNMYVGIHIFVNVFSFCEDFTNKIPTYIVVINALTQRK